MLAAARPSPLQGILWALFAQGAVLTAILVPVHILVQGVLGPLGVLPFPDAGYDRMAAAIANPLVKLYLLLLFSQVFYVFGHRTRYLLFDLGVRRGKLGVALVAYGLALAGTIAAAFILFAVA